MNRYILTPIILCLLSFTQRSIAQSYSPFLKNTTTCFNRYGSLMGVRFDSTISLGNDTTFISYHTFEDTSQNGYNYGDCVVNSKGKSWIGYGMTKKSNGDYLFANRFNDTILIKSQADLNETWKFMQVNDTSYLEASINSIEEMSFNNTTDSVKIIALQLKDNFGNLINSIWDNVQMWLSKNNGFLKVPSFYSIPSDTTRLNRFYFPDHTNAWYANHEIGDEVDIRHQAVNFETYSARKYIGKQYNFDSSTITYTIYCYNTVHTFSPPFFSDTSYQQTEIGNPSNDSSLACAESGYLTDEAIIDTVSYTGFTSHSSFDQCTQTVVTSPGETYLYCDGNYYSYPFELQGYFYTIYYCGIASLVNYFGEPGDELNFNQYLTYYKKGDIECGSSIIIGVPEVMSPKNSLTLFPNPANEFVTIQFSKTLSSSTQLRLISIDGKVLRDESLSIGHLTNYRMDIATVPLGIYCVELTDNSSFLTAKLIKN